MGLLLLPLMMQAQTSAVVSGKTEFSIKYWAGTCEGTFNAPRGTMKFDAAKPEATVIDVTIPAGSFHTGNNMRDKDVKAKKYLDAASFPQISFKSSKVFFKEGTYYANGTLKIKGVSKSVQLPFKATKNKDGSYAVTSKFIIDRTEFNVGEKGATMKNEVRMNISAVIK
jgi:polyisoprenoid-binding protein YceI